MIIMLLMLNLSLSLYIYIYMYIHTTLCVYTVRVCIQAPSAPECQKVKA